MNITTKTGPEPDKQIQDTPDRLAELEHVVKTGLSTYQEVGAALDEIKADKLYRRLGYNTFKQYLLDRWSISRAHGYRLINAAKVAKMSPIGDKPENEHQARPKPVSKVVFSLDAEFESFKSMVERWEQALSMDDFAKFMERIVSYLVLEPETEKEAA